MLKSLEEPRQVNHRRNPYEGRRWSLYESVRNRDGKIGDCNDTRCRSIRTPPEDPAGGFGFTQDELATISGLSVHAVSALERGERRRPHIETVSALAAAFDLSPEDREALLASARAKSPERRPPRTVPARPSLCR